MSKTYENKHWELDLTQGILVGKLHFTQYYDDEVILSFQQDKEEAECFWYVSEFLNVEHDCLFEVSPEEAMVDFEDMIIARMEDEISALEDMRDKFQEEKCQ